MSKINDFFAEKKDRDSKPQLQGFYSVDELDNEIWFGSDQGRIWIYNKKNGEFRLMETAVSSKIINIKDIDRQILIATENDGFMIYHKATGKLDRYNTSNLKDMQSNRIVSCYIDKSKNIWFELDCLGVARFNMSTREMKHFMMKIEDFNAIVFPHNFIIFEDKENRLWVHPRGGGFALYDPAKDALIPFYNEPNTASWHFSNMLHAGFSDKQGNLWISTRSHGLEKIIFNNDVFKAIVVDPNISSFVNNDIRALFEDSSRNLWVSTKGGKIYVYDSHQKQVGYLCKDGSVDYGAALDGYAYCIMQDKKGRIWIGTKGEGIYRLSPTNRLYKYDVTQYKNSDSDLYSLSNNSIYSIFEDDRGNIWVGTYGGGLNLLENGSDGHFLNYKNNLKQYPSQFGSQIRTISSDKYGNICIGTTLGLIMFSSSFDSVNDIDYKFYTRKPADDNSLSANDIYDICTTKSGETYIATFGGGVNKIVEVDKSGFPTKFKTYTTHEGLPSDVILLLMEDLSGDLWVLSEGNLTKFDPRKESFETYSEINRLIEGQNFSEGAKCLSKTGDVFFGFSKGFIMVTPDKIIDNTFIPYVALTRFQIANKDVPIGGESPLQKSIDDVDYIKLDHTQNFINIEFAALDYVDSKRVTYQYKLEGFDDDWVVAKKQRIANYTNLSPGEYTFRVKSTNSDGIWVNNEHVLKIEITPSFWQTGWAYFLYFIVSIAILYIVLKVIFTFYTLKHKIRLEHEETEMKTRFFTDISHEIRTPLTMIVSPVENIIEDEKTPSEVKGQLSLVLKNASRMLRMVNQILDFRKIQKQKLNIQETSIGLYVTDVCNNFSKTAEVQGVELIVNNSVADDKLWVDRDSIEKLVFNLLANAFKYTRIGKTIEVSISRKDNQISLQVKDEGQGMTKDVLNKIFTRFASFNVDKSKPSTGIGLSIVKEVADKHHAKILVESDLDKGSCFTILFQQGLDHFANDQTVDISQPDKESVPTPMPQPASESEVSDIATVEDKNDSNDVVLIVEDDPDLRGFIEQVLSPYYKILLAENGKTGYDIAVANLPDFILSDLMMPEMDGVEFLQKIRHNSETSHIPFILLTAKTAIESKLEGLNYGADDYITKPFSVRILRARIENIINQRKRLYNLYTNDKYALHPLIVPKDGVEEADEDLKFTARDEDFLKKVRFEIEKNIDDSNFMVEDLALAMAMSRTVFFKKIKSLTGLAPIEFIRDIRVKYGAKLIKTENYTIKEVAYMVGITDSKYFTQCFKKVFGVTPSEYKTQNKDTMPDESN